ncbi:hypothetical protein [Halorarius halobius]|uniref:EMC6-like membrane protein n=1 Tax=Halorarius halobius TaxID=2962671 RepID=UPI0020CF507B|nr:hypothetical protein [Halorarius halobius]
MATESAGRFSPHLRGLTVTALASVLGVAAAVVSSIVTAGAATPATDPRATYVLAGAILVQFPLLKLVGIDVEDFGAKDYLYVAFMTFALWFVCWGIFLTAGTTF